QRYAEEALAEHMKKLQRSFDAQWKERGSEPWADEGGYEIEDFIENKMKRTPVYHALVKRYPDHPDSVEIMLNLRKRMSVFSWNGDGDTLFRSLDSLRYYNRCLQAGLMAMDPHTGEVKAWVSGINHKYFKLD